MTKRHPPTSTTVVGPPKTLMPIGCLLAFTGPTRTATQAPREMFRSSEPLSSKRAAARRALSEARHDVAKAEGQRLFKLRVGA
jgi:hypothetical protein